MPRSTYADRLAFNANLDAHLLQLGDDDAQVRRFHIVNGDIAASDSRRNHDGARHKPVRHWRVLDGMKPVDAIDDQGIAAEAADIGAHRVEEVAKVQHFGFKRRVFQNGLPISQGGGQHQVLRAGVAGQIQIERGALESTAAKVNNGSPVLEILHIGAQARETAMMEIYFARANIAAATARQLDISQPNLQRRQE